jgi:hypothetical protein
MRAMLMAVLLLSACQAEELRSVLPPATRPAITAKPAKVPEEQRSRLTLNPAKAEEAAPVADDPLGQAIDAAAQAKAAVERREYVIDSRSARELP